MKKLAGLIVGAMALLVVSAAPARAQVWASAAFTLQEWNSDPADSMGFALDFGGVIHKTSKTAGALYVDFSYNSFQDFDENDLGFVGGFREFFMVHKRVMPYVHVSTGLMRWSVPDFDISSNDWTIGFGAGVQFPITDMFGVKVQYDWWKPWEDGDWNGHIGRWSFGGTYTWGGGK